MSEWPKKYECLDLDEDLDYNTPDRWIQCVSLEDFEWLLDYFSEVYYGDMSHVFKDPDDVKTFIIEQITERMEREKNDR